MASQVRRALPQDVSFFKGQSPDDRERAVRLLKRTSLKRQSKGLKAELLKYRKLSAAFLGRPENKWCLCCTLRREKLQEDITRNQATEIHHTRGRIGRLLCWVPGFRPFCFDCRSWPHDHPSKARELNLLCPAPLWEIFPGDY